MRLADQRIKEQAIKREYELAQRRKRDPKFAHGWGHSTVGSIHDCNRAAFERSLRAYWDRLYVGWNPYKKDGNGCWEVWQKPAEKRPILAYDDETTNTKIYTLEAISSDYIHWVADLDYLSYDFIAKLRSMDAWEDKQLLQKHDDAYEAHFDKLEREENENIKYVVKHNKQVFRDLLDYTQQGFNPLDFFNKR